MKFMARRAPERFEKLAAAVNAGFDFSRPLSGAVECIKKVEIFIDSMGLPRSLQQVGVRHEDLGQVVADIHHEITLLDTVGALIRPEDVADLLEDMYLPRNNISVSETLL